MEFPFFHGNITRKTCEELLSKKKKNGSYLIRESESVEGALCLCVLMSPFMQVLFSEEHVDFNRFLRKAKTKICIPVMPLFELKQIYCNWKPYPDLSSSFEDFIYTYRIFREHQGYFRMQTSEGVPERTFKTLKDLIYTFEKPNQGLVTNLRYPVKKLKASQRSQRFKSGMDSVYAEVDDSSDYITVLP